MTVHPAPGQGSGNPWTEKKLQVIGGYLQSYSKALKNQGFRTIYIDAFAGTGYRDDHPGVPRDEEGLLFPALAGQASQALLAGSARRALTCNPPFHKYVFIERDQRRCRSLRHLAREFPNLTDRIEIREGDANQEVPLLCDREWLRRRERGVIFLDPYGMQVAWTTIKAIAATKALDLWVLFPLGVAVNRLVTRSGNISSAWCARLDHIFGTTDWRQKFYNTKVERTLFGEEEQVEKVSVDAIGRYFNDRLRTRFPAVAPKPGVMRNSTQNPLYLLCFAVANPKWEATGLALRIAGHLLKDIQ